MNWFVAYSKSRSELKAMDYFEKTGINSYVPCYKEKREWSDRVKIVKVPAISGYVFFELNKLDYNCINLNPFVKNVIRRNGKAITVKHEEIQTLKNALNGFYASKCVDLGDTVKILSGLFKNKLGVVDNINERSLTVLINSIKVRLSLADTRLKSAV